MTLLPGRMQPRREDAQPNEGSSRVHLSAAPTLLSQADLDARKRRASLPPARKRPTLPAVFGTKLPQANGGQVQASASSNKRVKLDHPVNAVPARPAALGASAASSNGHVPPAGPRNPVAGPPRAQPAKALPTLFPPSPAAVPPPTHSAPPTEPRAIRAAREAVTAKGNLPARPTIDTAKGKERAPDVPPARSALSTREDEGQLSEKARGKRRAIPSADDIDGEPIREAPRTRWDVQPARREPSRSGAIIEAIPRGQHRRFDDNGRIVRPPSPSPRRASSPPLPHVDSRSYGESQREARKAKGGLPLRPAGKPPPPKQMEAGQKAAKAAKAKAKEPLPTVCVRITGVPERDDLEFIARFMSARCPRQRYDVEQRLLKAEKPTVVIRLDTVAQARSLALETRKTVFERYTLRLEHVYRTLKESEHFDRQVDKTKRKRHHKEQEMMRNLERQQRKELAQKRGENARARPPPSSRSPTVARSRQASWSIHRPPSPERRLHELSFACRENVPWHQQTAERETRLALAEASRDGFMVDRHYRDGLVLVMEGHQKRIKSEVMQEPSMTVGTSTAMEEDVPDETEAYSPPPAEPYEEPVEEDRHIKEVDEDVAPSTAEAQRPERVLATQHADVVFPFSVYETVSPSHDLLTEIHTFLKNFLQLFDESRGALVDYYTAQASFSFSTCGRLTDFPSGIARLGRNSYKGQSGAAIASTPYGIVNAMRKLPAVQHDFTQPFTFDHWPLYDGPTSPLICTVNGEWEEFATSQIRSFSRTLVLVPVSGSQAVLPGVGFQIQSDQLIIRPHGNLLAKLSLREPTPALEHDAESVSMSDIDGMPIDPDSIDGFALPSDDEQKFRELDSGATEAVEAPFIISDDDEEPPTRSISVLSLAEEADQATPRRAEPDGIIDLDSEEEEYEPAPAAAETAIPMQFEEDSKSSSSSSSSEDDEDESESEEEQSAAEVDEGPHLEGSMVAFFTPPVTAKTVRQRKTKMRAFFDVGPRYLAVAKNADILSWSKRANRGKVETAHYAPPGQDVHCATHDEHTTTLFLGHQTSKGSDAAQLSYLPPTLPRQERIRMLTNRPHADGVSALCPLPSSSNRALIATGGWDHCVKLWSVDVDSNALTASSIDSLPKHHRSVVQALSWSTGQNALVSGGADARIFAWDVQQLREKSTIKWKEQSRVSQLQACPGQEHLMLVTLSSSDEQLRLYDLRDCRPVSRFGFRSAQLLNLTAFSRGAFSPSGQLFALPAEDRIHLWDLRNVASPSHLLDSPSPGGVQACFESDLELTILESSSFAYHRVVL